MAGSMKSMRRKVKVLASHFDRLARCSDLGKFDVLEAGSVFMTGVVSWPESRDECRRDAYEALAEYFKKLAEKAPCRAEEIKEPIWSDRELAGSWNWLPGNPKRKSK